jgi:hypothetical protein
MKAILQFKLSIMSCLRIAITMLIIFNGINLTAQQDTTKEKTRKNTVRFNISNPALFGPGSLVFGYERVLKNNQSISVNFGKASFPKLTASDEDSQELDLRSNSSENGFNFSVDYRFYLKGENKYAAPRGVYIGPYYSYNYFDRVNKWSLTTTDFQGDVQSDMTMNFHTAGFELGYQFVFWKKLSIDMVLLGPGVASYSIKAKLDTTLDPDQEQLFFDALNNFLASKFPNYDRVIDAGEFKRSGAVQSYGIGFRYMIMIGFRF